MFVVVTWVGDHILGNIHNTAVATMESDHGDDDNLVLILEVHYRGKYTSQTIFYRCFDSFRISDVKRQLAMEYGLVEQRLWLVHDGRKLKDEELVKNVGSVVSLALSSVFKFP